MTQAGKVAEIFSVAGEAFTQLANLAMCLQPASTQDGGKWEDEEIDQLRKAVAQFGDNIEKISEKIKTKSTTQIKNTLKGKTNAREVNGAPRGRKPNHSKLTTVNTDAIAQQPTTNSYHNDMAAEAAAAVAAISQNINAVNTNTGNMKLQQQQQQQQLQSHATLSLPVTHNATTPTVVYVTTVPPGLKPIAAKPTAATSGMKPTYVTFQGLQGQSIQMLKSDDLTSGMLHPIALHNNNNNQTINISPQALTIKSGTPGALTPASIISSQLNKSPMKIVNIPRTLGQKSKLDNSTVAGMMSLQQQQQQQQQQLVSITDINNKKVKVDPANFNILTSTLLSQKPLIRSQTPAGIPGVVSSQGFQVIMPASSKNLYPVGIRPTAGVSTASISTVHHSGGGGGGGGGESSSSENQ